MTSHDRSHRARKQWDMLRQAFSEFLWVPTSIIAGFLLLAAATFLLDRGDTGWLLPLRSLLQAYAFADAAVTRELLGNLSAGLITITSITVSLLLIALQQSASALTHQVYDQFLRKWHNQVYFGFFVGLSVYVLLTLASAGRLNAVFGGAFSLLGTIVALCLLLVLFYTTVNQMRPEVIIEAIHQFALAARESQLEFLRSTRRAPRLNAPVRLPVTARTHGFITHIDVDSMKAAAAAAGAPVEIVLRVTLGAYVVFGQQLAEVVAHTLADARIVAADLDAAIHRAGQRDIAADPLDAIEELETIGWTAISTAQSDPDAGVLTICSLRDILARWSGSPEELEGGDVAPIVYTDDVLPRLLSAFESLAVSASESLQHQSLVEILRTFELLFEHLPAALQLRVEDIVVRTLSGLGDHILTHELETALTGLIGALDAAGRGDTAATVLTARKRLARSIGKLGGRSTRAG